jgi:hypothetical protein
MKNYISQGISLSANYTTESKRELLDLLWTKAILRKEDLKDWVKEKGFNSIEDWLKSENCKTLEEFHFKK